MRRWEQRTLYQQLAIILGFICSLLLIFFLKPVIQHLQGSLLFVLLAIFLPLLLILYSWQKIRKIVGKLSGRIVSVPVSHITANIPQEPKQAISKKLIIAIGLISFLLLMTFAYSVGFRGPALLFAFAWSSAGTYIVLGGIMQNLRNKALTALVKACLQYANDHDNEWPKNLQTLIETKYISPNILINPNQPQRKIGYTYLRPLRNALPEQIVIYESHDTWEGSISVAYVDGQIRWIKTEVQFKKLLAEAKEQNEKRIKKE